MTAADSRTGAGAGLAASKAQVAFIALVALVLTACAGEVAAPEVAAEPLGVGTSPGFSDWITPPSILVGEPVVTGPDVDCPGCPPVVRQEIVVADGSYGFDSDGDRTFDQVLTLEAVVVTRVAELEGGAYEYTWRLENHGSGAIVALSCGPNALDFSASLEEPLLGTAGADRIVDTADDLTDVQTHALSLVHALAPRAVLCAITTNPTTPRSIELLVPRSASPTAREQCKASGWLDFGFRNQGMCVRYVETGLDDRPPAEE